MENISTKIEEMNEVLQRLNTNNFSEESPETAVLSELMIVLNQFYNIVADRRDQIINTKN